MALCNAHNQVFWGVALALAKKFRETATFSSKYRGFREANFKLILIMIVKCGSSSFWVTVVNLIERPFQSFNTP